MDSANDAIQLYDTLAVAYQQKFAPMRIYDASYDAFLKRLGDDAAVLDIGCGPGIISSYLQQKKPSLKIHCVDGSPEMIAIAKGCVNAEFTVADCRNIEISRQYDAIVSGFLIPYLSPAECEQFIKRCANLLCIDGLLYISFQEDSHTESGIQHSSDGKNKLFMNYYLEADLAGWFEAAGLETLQVIRVPYGETDIATHAIMIAGKR